MGSAALGIGLIILIVLIVVGVAAGGLYMLILGAYDTFFADKASIWSIAYLIIGFILIFGGIGGGSKAKS